MALPGQNTAAAAERLILFPQRQTGAYPCQVRLA
jgi:hypothetical protein